MSMVLKLFSDRAHEALECTQQGLRLLIEANELGLATTNMLQNDDYHSLVEEMIEKQKLAVELIQRAMLIEKNLMQTQAGNIERIMRELS